MASVAHANLLRQQCRELNLRTEVLAGEEGLVDVAAHPDVDIYTAAIDRGLNAHGYIVLLVVAYLLWTKRQHLAATVCRPSWKGFTALVLLSVVAMAGELASVAAVVQFALVFLIAADCRPIRPSTATEKITMLIKASRTVMPFVTSTL